MDITDHYELVEEGKLFDTLEEAQEAAGNDANRIWFVRHGDGLSTGTTRTGRVRGRSGTVELNCGQYVNRAGYFVSVEPCRIEHRYQIFTY